MKKLFISFFVIACAHGQNLYNDSNIYYDINYKKKLPQYPPVSIFDIDTVAVGDTIFINWLPVREPASYEDSTKAWDKAADWKNVTNGIKWQPTQPVSQNVQFVGEISFEEEGIYTFRVWSWRFVPENKVENRWIHSVSPSSEIAIHVVFPDDITKPGTPVILPIVIRRS